MADEKTLTITMSRDDAMQTVKDIVVLVTANSTLAGREAYQSRHITALLAALETGLIEHKTEHMAAPRL